MVRQNRSTGEVDIVYMNGIVQSSVVVLIPAGNTNNVFVGLH